VKKTHHTHPTNFAPLRLCVKKTHPTHPANFAPLREKNYIIHTHPTNFAPREKINALIF